MYANGSGISASEIEQGIVLGAFLGSVVTNPPRTALTKTICKGLVPELIKSLEYAEVGEAAQVARSMNQGLREVLTSNLTEELEVDTARGIQFASQMEEMIRLVDSTGSLAEGFEFLNRELVTSTANAAEAVAAKLVGKPAVSRLVQLSHNTLGNQPIEGAPGMALFLFDESTKPIGLMSRFMSHFTNTQEVAKTLGGPVAESVTTVAHALTAMTEGVESAAENVGSTMACEAGKMIRGATDFAKNVLNSLPNSLDNLPNPFGSLFHYGDHHAAPGSNDGSNGGEHCAQAAVTAYV